MLFKYHVTRSVAFSACACACTYLRPPPPTTSNRLLVMADVPVVFKKSRTKNTQRSRVATPDITESAGEGGQTADVEDDESPSLLATKLKKKLKTREKPKSRLSFGAEEVRCLNAAQGRWLMSGGG